MFLIVYEVGINPVEILRAKSLAEIRVDIMLNIYILDAFKIQMEVILAATFFRDSPMLEAVQKVLSPPKPAPKPSSHQPNPSRRHL